ncbi:MAG: hypothetical protein JKY71_07085 [Alphaproteobacteria bacterium]|nr:hypothetical protein [Alphaproteobacteria bacterium]
MKYTVNEAAKIVGATRQTIYRHIESKPISVEKDENGNQLIDASELLRVYGDKLDFEALNEDDSDHDVTQDVTPRNNAAVTVTEDKIELVKLQGEIDKLQEIMNRTEDENAYLKQLLEEEKTERKKANNLLEDMRSQEDKSKAWENSFKALENRIANQEKSAKEREEREQKILRQNRALRNALKEEQSKSIWKKLFG